MWDVLIMITQAIIKPVVLNLAKFSDLIEPMLNEAILDIKSGVPNSFADWISSKYTIVVNPVFIVFGVFLVAGYRHLRIEKLIAFGKHYDDVRAKNQENLKKVHFVDNLLLYIYKKKKNEWQKEGFIHYLVRTRLFTPHEDLYIIGVITEILHDYL